MSLAIFEAESEFCGGITDPEEFTLCWLPEMHDSFLGCTIPSFTSTSEPEVVSCSRLSLIGFLLVTDLGDDDSDAEK